MRTSTVRIAPAARKVLQQLSRRMRQPSAVILGIALEEFRRKCVLEESNRAFAALKRDKAEWAREKQERRVWDVP